MEVRYSPGYVQLMMTVAALNIFAGLLAIVARTNTWFLLILGIFLLFVSLGARKKPYLTVEPNSIVLHALIGSLKRRFLYDSSSDVKIENNKLYVIHNGQRKNVPISKWIIRAEDWAALEAKFS